MRKITRKITQAFAAVALIGSGAGVAHANQSPDPVAASAPADTNQDRRQPTAFTPYELPDDDEIVQRTTMQQRAVIQQPIATSARLNMASNANTAPAPRAMGDYERDLPLPRCERTSDLDYSKMEAVMRYKRYPHLTPRVDSPNVTAAQVEMTQQYLRTLGFRIDDDGIAGPATTRAIMEFQMFWGPISNSMEIDGVIDNNLIRHLEYYAAIAQRDARTYNVSNTGVVAAIRMAALRKNDNFEFLMEMALRESSFDPNAQARTSSADGLFQHINRTLDKNMIYAGCNYGLGEFTQNYSITRNGRDAAEINYNGSSADYRFLQNLRFNPRFSAILAVENNQYEVGLVEDWLGISLQENYQRYSIHFKGVDAGYFFWRGYRDTPNQAAAPTFRRQARANRAIYYNRGHARSYRQISTWFENHFGTGRFYERYRVAAYQPPMGDSRIGYAGRVDTPQEQPATGTSVQMQQPAQTSAPASNGQGQQPAQQQQPPRPPAPGV